MRARAAAWPRGAALAAALLVVPAPARAQAPAEGGACEEAIAAAEGDSGLPPGLLGAIARTESGRYDPARRRFAPWPWTINAAGIGAHFESREDAVARVRDLLARGVRSVDVGCMQVNLRHHPSAFASLEEAFDPRANIAYAIRFLAQLRLRHGDWPGAVAGYHSADAARGADYLRRVNLAWTGAPPVAAEPSLPGRVAPPAEPAVARIRVFTPAALTPAARPMGVVVTMPRRG